LLLNRRVNVKATALLLKALGDEARLSMLWLLMHQAEVCVCDFMEVLGCTQSKASRHLRTLFHAGLVSHRRAGRWSHYSLKPARDPVAATILAALRDGLGTRRGAGRLLGRLTAAKAGKGRTSSSRCD
jgi:ArsR family transcriptional regulator